jgi:hypothetical protein
MERCCSGSRSVGLDWMGGDSYRYRTVIYVLFLPVMSMHPGALISLLIFHPLCTVHPSPHVVVPIVTICQEMDLF